MISSKRKKQPKPSLDDFLDELINNPTDVDLQLIGDVQADKSKSSRMIKGQAELIELNAWIDTHNKHPSVDSADFKESQLARRMNGYAFKPAEHEELKPFDKHNLINATLYQKPTVNAFLEEAQPVELDQDDTMAVSDADIDGNNASTAIFTPVAQPTSLLAGIDELPLFDALEIEPPVSKTDTTPELDTPNPKTVAAAILKLRNEKNNEATRVTDDDFTLTNGAAPELPLSDNAPNLPDTPLELTLSYLDITFNPPANARAYDDINYVRKATETEVDAGMTATAIDPADEIKEVFSSVPSPDHLPTNYQDKEYDDLSDSSYNPFGFTEYYDGAFDSGTASTTSVDTDTKARESVTGDTLVVETSSKPVSGKPESVPEREWYWSIDGEIDPNVINSDAATGLTQRHNPSAPMFKDSARQPCSDAGDSSPTTKPPRERIGLNRTKATSDKARTKPRPHEVVNAVTKPIVSEPVTVDFEHLLSDDIAAGVKKVTEKLDAPVKKFGSIDDILDDDLDFLESLTADEDKYFDIDNNFAMTGAGMKNAPDEIGKQTPCQDFYMYESHFRNLHARLESGDLKTIRHTATNHNQGDAFILDGMVGFIQSMGEERVGSRGRHDPRLRLVFDNRTESNILLSTLNKRLYTDQNGRRIIPSADDFADFDTPKAQAKVRTGQIYIVRTLSSNPKLRQIPNLYKIGFTKSTVEERTKNATRDIAFLESPVEVMLKADCFDTDPRGLESLIHGFLHHQRINITLTGKNGGKYHPQEWFSISLEEAKKVISAIVDHSIIDYRMDNTTNRMVKKSL